MSRQTRSDALRGLIAAAGGRTWHKEEGGTISGWGDPDHRRAPSTAIAVEGGSVRLAPDAVTSLEEGVGALLQLAGVRANWEDEDLWAMAASMVATLPNTDLSGLQVELSRRLGRLEDPGPTVTAFVVDGARWEGPPRTLSDVVLGAAGKEWSTRLNVASGPRPVPLPDRKKGWLARIVPEGGTPPVVAATWVDGSHRRALHQGRRRFLELLEASLIFKSEVGDAALLQLRGTRLEPIDVDLGTTAFARGRLGDAPPVDARTSRQVPLDQLLEIGVARGLVEATHSSRSALSQRLRAAARWHARALQGTDPAEGIVAVWTAFEALLGDGSASPDKALSNRYAMLHPDRADVEEAYGWFVGRFRPVRLAALHGGDSALVGSLGFVDEAAGRLRWAAARVWGLLVERGGTRDDDYGELFRDLKTKLTGG